MTRRHEYLPRTSGSAGVESHTQRISNDMASLLLVFTLSLPLIFLPLRGVAYRVTENNTLFIP
jgi:hypothetical protein